MKILQVLPFFGPKFGGSFVCLYNISKELSKLGHEVTIITTDFRFDNKYKESIEKEGVKVVDFHCKFNLGLFLISPSMKGWLEKNIQNFDVIHMQNFRSYQNNLVYKYAKKYGVPYILQAHGSLPLKTGKPILKGLYDSFWGFKLLNDASKVIALTNIELEQYKLMGVEGNKIEIVPNGLDLSEFSNLPEKGNFRRKYGINNETNLILYLGQIYKIKGIQLLVDAFSDLLKNEQNIELAIVGPDSGFLSDSKKQIDKLGIEDKIHFTGPLYGKNKLEAYVDADVYVLPSILEGFGITVIEACACGTPVIVTKGCGLSNFVEKVGYVVEYDKEQLKNSLILSLKEGTPHKSTKLRNKTISEFDLDDTLNKIVLIYESVKEN